MRVYGCKWSWILAALLLVTCDSALTAEPARGKLFQLTIDRGPLPFVLEQFSKQTGLQIGTQLNVSESATAEIGPFVGRASADEALKSLLKDTDLSYTWQDKYTIRIFVTVVGPPRSEDNVREVIVTGSRLPGHEQGPATVRLYGSSKVQRNGATSVSDWSRYLTQQPFSFGSGHLQSGAQFFQMRGLGFDTTLVLINGRRAPPSANSISLNAFDLNSVPLTAVERIEVMSDSASAIYGADAIGGVVNLVLKKNIEEPEVYLHYGQADGGGAQRRAAASLGAGSDSLKSVLVLDYYETTALMGEERELWRNQDYRRFGGLDYRVSASNPGNVYSLSGQPLPGLSSTRAAVPPGTTRTLTPADFFATDGATNLASSFSNWSITPPIRRLSAYGSAEYSAADSFSLFGEILAESSEVTALRAPPSLIRQFVPQSHPFNPFGVPVAVDYLFADMAPISHLYETDLLRLVAGARGKLSHWEWEVAAVRTAEDGTNTTHGEIDRLLVNQSMSSPVPDTALNLFTTGSPGSPELLAALRSPPQKFSFSFSSSQLTAFIRGPLFDIGERSAELVIGGEWRLDEAGFTDAGKRVAADREITSVFWELKIPLLDELSLKIAARGDDLGTSARIVNPQYGLIWRPTRDWLFRAAYGTSFRPPSLFELYMPMLHSAMVISDPLRSGEVSNAPVFIGGNPDLEVVTARSFTTGVVFTPPLIPGMRVGANYWRIAMDNRIMTPVYSELLRPGSPLADRVVREVPDGEGQAGRVRSMDLTRLNYGDLETSGIDFDASLPLERGWGCWNLDLAATWVDEFLSRDMNRALPVDRVGIANVQGTIPEWRIAGSLTWKRGDFGISTTTTYVPSYQDADLFQGPLDRRISAQVTFDLQTWMDLETDGLLDRSRFTLGARNLFNETPDFAHAGASLGHDFSQGELVGRFIYLRASKRF